MIGVYRVVYSIPSNKEEEGKNTPIPVGGDDGLNPSSRCSVVNCTRKLLHSPPESPSRLSSTPESQNQSKTSSIVVRLWKSYLYYFNSWDGNEGWGCCSVQKKKKEKKIRRKKKLRTQRKGIRDDWLMRIGMGVNGEGKGAQLHGSTRVAPTNLSTTRPYEEVYYY